MKATSQAFIPPQNIYVQQILPQQQFFQGQQVGTPQQSGIVILTLNGIQTRIQSLINEKMRDIINRFNIKLKININKVQYLYNGS